jgi:actin-related protein 6
VLYGRPIQSAIRRLELGGKQLTNYLKELISLRHYGLMDDPYLVSQIKEDACFISQDFRRDVEKAWKGNGPARTTSTNQAQVETVQEYVLPDYLTTFRGHLRDRDPTKTVPGNRFGTGATNPIQAHEESFPLGNERFVVPELLFNPSDIGMSQAGLPEVVVQSLSSLPAGLWPVLLANVIVVGGNAKTPGFVERLQDELRALTPADLKLRVRCPEE